MFFPKPDTKCKYISIDTETTGLKRYPDGYDEIVELSVIEFEILDTKPRVGSITTMKCSPFRGYIPSEASVIHGIKYEDVKDKPVYMSIVKPELVEFIGSRTVVGHNILDFDFPMLRIHPESYYDTLVVSRENFKGKHGLRYMCTKLKIDWDESKAHGAEYDAYKAMQLCVALKFFERNKELSKTTIFTETNNTDSGQVDTGNTVDNEVVQNSPTISQGNVFGVTLTLEQKSLINKIPFSHSSMAKYKNCPLSWFYSYVFKLGREKIDYLVVGSTCHTAAEKADEWCFKHRWISMWVSYHQIIANEQNPVKSEDDLKSEAIDIYESRAVYSGPLGSFPVTYLSIENRILTSGDGITSFEMPPLEEFNKIVEAAKAVNGCNTPELSNDVDWIMRSFFKKSNLSILPGEMAKFEMDVAINRDLVKTGFNSPDVFLRGKIDRIVFNKSGKVLIKDYKSSRTMLDEDKLRNDIQTKIYVYLVVKSLNIPISNSGLNSVTLIIDYLRFNKSIEYTLNTCEEINTLISDVEVYINNTVNEIHNEAAKESNSFEPQRNEFCNYCQAGDNGFCPLFNRFKEMCDTNERIVVNSIESCSAAWNVVESMKADIKRLQAECKGFIENTTDPVMVNGARLSFYTSETESIKVNVLIKELEKYGISFEAVLPYLNMTKSNLDKMIKKLKVVDPKSGEYIKLDEIDFSAISEKSTEKSFKALTDKQIETGGFINVL